MLTREQTAQARDIIEVLAIFGAAIWAIYVFAYEQRIKPASEPPSMTISGSLNRLGERNGLLQIGFKSVFRNTGSSDVSIIAIGFTALGIRFTTRNTPALNTLSGLTLYQRDARAMPRTRVYELTELMNVADKRIKETLSDSPGEDFPFQSIFLVKRAAFDAVVLYGSVAYTRGTTPGGYPTEIIRTKNDAVYFGSKNSLRDYYPLQEKVDEITLW